MLSPHGVELRKRRAARAERRARERNELQRKRDEDEKMQKTLKELEEQRQVLAFYGLSLFANRDALDFSADIYSHKYTPTLFSICPHWTFWLKPEQFIMSI